MINNNKIIEDNNSEDDELLAEVLEYSEKFSKVEEEATFLRKECSEAMKKVEVYGGIDKVPEDKKYLVEDVQNKYNNLARHTIMFKNLIDEYEDFWDCANRKDSDILS